MSTAALSPWTGRPLPGNSKLAASRMTIEVKAAERPASPDMASILRRESSYRWMMPLLSSITPTYIEQTLRGAFAGSHVQAWQLFDLMEDTWPRLAKNLNEIKRAVIALDWSLEAWEEEDEPPTEAALERKKLISTAIWRMQPDPTADENGFQQTLYDVLDAWGKGVSVLEILWHQRPAGELGDITAPRATAWVRPDMYAWAGDNRLGLNPNALQGYANSNPSRGYLVTPSYYAAPEDIVEFPPDKFLVAVAKAKTGHPLAGALLRPLAWWWCASNFSADWLMNLAQIFGLPFRWATYASGTPQATVNAISAVLENMGSSSWAAFPEGTTMDLKEAQQGRGQSPQSDLLDRADKNCDLLILGQTLTSDTGGMGGGSGSMALGRVHQGVKDANIMAAAEFAAEVINCQLIPAILRANYGDDEERPEFEPEFDEEEDHAANAARDAALLSAGIEMPKKWFYKRHDIPLPEEGEEVIGGQPDFPSGNQDPKNSRPPTEQNPKAIYDETRPERNGMATEDMARSMAAHALAANCGTGAGGFQPGNTCAGEGGIDSQSWKEHPKVKPIFKEWKDAEKEFQDSLDLAVKRQHLRRISQSFSGTLGATGESFKEYEYVHGPRFESEQIKNVERAERKRSAAKMRLLEAISESKSMAASARPQPVKPAQVNRLAAAFAEDLAPFRDRLERILSIQDDGIMRAKLTALQNEIPSLLKDINADPESARVLEDSMAAGVLQIISKRTEKPRRK